MGKVAFITGATGGIGTAMAETFMKRGDKVVFSDMAGAPIAETVKKYKEQGFECHGIECDVVDESQINAAIDETVKKYGSLDILINNAGLQHVCMIEDFPTERFKYLIDVMTIAPFVATKRVLPIMKANKYGRIINMSSINGVIGFAGKSAYNTAKHGLIGLTRVTALEVANHGITANAVCPGYTDTFIVRNQFEDLARTRNIPLEEVLDQILYPLIPMRRLLNVQEIADYVDFLTSEKASAITGQVCLVDGGYTVQ